MPLAKKKYLSLEAELNFARQIQKPYVLVHKIDNNKKVQPPIKRNDDLFTAYYLTMQLHAK